MLNQRLQQKLVQKLSPQQVLVMRLLQEPLLSLEQRIKQEIEDNPALEEAATDYDEQETQDETPGDSVDSDEDEFHEDEEPVAKEEEEYNVSDYLEDDEIPEYRLNANNSSPDDEIRETPLASGMSFQDFLLDQLGLFQVNSRQEIIARTIIGNLDESGYLQREISALCDDLAFNQAVEVTPEEVLEVLEIVQQFDPPGIGARNLRECLIIQLYNKPSKNGSTKLALDIIENHFNEFIKKHYDKILNKTKVSEDELKKAIEEIQKLNPKPGAAISEVTKESNYIIPDFIITSHEGDLELTLNSRNMPDLGMNRQYIEMLREYSNAGKKSKVAKEAATFIRQKLDAARGFIDAIKQRQETLYISMKAIMEYQREYFLSGDETKLRPMILKDIANIIGMDISTVSRVANSKYVQTPFGTFLLKSFFSESMQNTKGEEISTREIKKILQDCIAAEDKSEPYTDDHLVEILKEKGYNIARRTIAKYREQLNIPVARMRKEL